MITTEAIEALQKAEAIECASAALSNVHLTHSSLALPADFTVHDLEKFMPVRRRMRGTHATWCLDAFAEYVRQHNDDGMVFVGDNLSATAVLNLGNNEHPGHTDHRAELTLKIQQPYAALLDLAKRGAVSQREFAEFLEDWHTHITLQSNGNEMALNTGIAAVRKLTVAQSKKAEHTTQALSQSRSTFEQIEATSDNPLPTLMVFTCQPYHPLQTYSMAGRISVLTQGADTVALKLNLICHDEKRDQMAAELADLVREKLATSNAELAVPVIKGTFKG